MLKIKNLYASVEETSILNGIDLEVKAGETHAIMGPNGSGKSTLAQVIAGHEDYEVEKGSIEYFCEDLLENYCVGAIDGKILYSDDDHLSIEGAYFISNLVLKEINNLLLENN